MRIWRKIVNVVSISDFDHVNDNPDTFDFDLTSEDDGIFLLLSQKMKKTHNHKKERKKAFI